MKKIIITLIALILAIFIWGWQVIYAIANGQPACILAQDTITCVKVGVLK